MLRVLSFANDKIRWTLSPNGTGTGLLSYNLDTVITAGHSYYAVAAFNLNGTGKDNITLYLVDLSTGVLQFQTHTTSLTSLRNSVGSFSIGDTDTGTSPFTGLIDEVRLSNTRLGVDDLLFTATIPELGSFALLVGGLVLGVVGVRRNRHRG